MYPKFSKRQRKQIKMFEKTFRLFDTTMKTFDRELSQILKGFHGKIDCQTRVKIKAGSTVIINGAKATLTSDVEVLTYDPDTLMRKKL